VLKIFVRDTNTSDNILLISILRVHAKKHKGRQSQIIMLGSQSLEQLHDSIYCNNCRASFESFIYIGEKFFVPSHALVGRTSSTLKLIDDIQQWISNDASTSQPAEAHRVATLDSITMSELKIETGKKYLYCHGGSCEHIVVISDIRTYSPRLDPHHITDFPAQKNVAFRKRRKCGVCKAMFARLIVFGDRLTDSNPFFFCDQCYYMLHYDASGQLQYSDYQVYQYSHDML
jgi:snRNA-activating protein complex subunit 3